VFSWLNFEEVRTSNRRRGMGGVDDDVCAPGCRLLRRFAALRVRRVRQFGLTGLELESIRIPHPRRLRPVEHWLGHLIYLGYLIQLGHLIQLELIEFQLIERRVRHHDGWTDVYVADRKLATQC
jgi:hypothetical protein